MPRIKIEVYKLLDGTIHFHLEVSPGYFDDRSTRLPYSLDQLSTLSADVRRIADYSKNRAGRPVRISLSGTASPEQTKQIRGSLGNYNWS